MTKTFDMKNLPTLVPYLTVKDLKKSIAFYEKAFGFQVQGDLIEQEGKVLHAELSFADTLLLFGSEGAYGSDKLAPESSKRSTPMSLWLSCDDPDAQHKKAVSAGAVSIMEPNDAFWGARVCMLKDLDGYEWGFSKAL